MAERKKLTMYYPPDFDPKLVPRRKRVKNFTCEVRMMLPFSVQCNKCGEFMYMGKKFNSMKENADGEKFKGIQIIRFYIKCGTCSHQMSFKTDPENDDYQMESGGTRTFEMWQETNAVAAANLEERIGEDKDDAMTALENRTKDTQKMVDMLDALDELKAVSQRNERIDSSILLNSVDHQRKAHQDTGLDADDEALVNSISFGNGDKRADGRPLGDEVDEPFVLDELESRSSGSGKYSRKRVGEKRGKNSSKNDTASTDKQSGASTLDETDQASVTQKFDQVGIDVHLKGNLSKGEAGEVDMGKSMLQQVQERTAMERAKDSATLPVLKKRKILKKVGSLGTSAPKSQIPATAASVAEEGGGGGGGGAMGGLLGLGEYGSESD